MDYIAQTPDVGLSPEDAESLFGNIEEIYHFNRCVVRISVLTGEWGGEQTSNRPRNNFEFRLNPMRNVNVSIDKTD